MPDLPASERPSLTFQRQNNIDLPASERPGRVDERADDQIEPMTFDKHFVFLHLEIFTYHIAPGIISIWIDYTGQEQVF